MDWSATVGMFGAHLHDSDTVLLGIAANIDTPSQSFGNSVAESSFLGLSFYFFAMNQRVQILTSTVSIVSHLSSYCRGSFSGIENCKQALQRILPSIFRVYSMYFVRSLIFYLQSQ